MPGYASCSTGSSLRYPHSKSIYFDRYPFYALLRSGSLNQHPKPHPPINPNPLKPQKTNDLKHRNPKDPRPYSRCTVSAPLFAAYILEPLIVALAEPFKLTLRRNFQREPFGTLFVLSKPLYPKPVDPKPLNSKP